MTQANTHYKTSDTPLAAYLITKHFFLVSVDYDKPRFEFVFPDLKPIQEEANNYLIGNALADPSHYARILKKLNRIISKRIQWEED